MYQSLPFTVRRPLLDLSTAAAITDRSHKELLSLIEEGRLRYSFNITVKPARIRCVRVASESLHQFINNQVPPASDDTPQRLRELVTNFFPALSETISITNLARTLNCGPDLLIHLHKAGAIRCARIGRRGYDGATRFDRRSVIAWLENGRMKP